MVDAYPLQWPTWKSRRLTGLAKAGKFVTKYPHSSGNYLVSRPITISEAVRRIQDELDRIGAQSYVLSSNVPTRLDGLPRGDVRRPDDPGVALYFQRAGKPYCLPCDTYTEVAQNMAAIAAHMEAARAIERHGVASVEEIYTGFQALPAPGQAESQKWFRVLGFVEGTIPSKEEINARYRELAKKVAGSEAALAELNVARDQALQLPRIV